MNAPVNRLGSALDSTPQNSITPVAAGTVTATKCFAPARESGHAAPFLDWFRMACLNNRPNQGSRRSKMNEQELRD
jgi:hypothetical protein